MPKKATLQKPSAAQKPRAQSRGLDSFMESLNHLQDQQSPFFLLLGAAVNNMVSTVQHFHSVAWKQWIPEKETR